MISPKMRTILDRYTLASKALSRFSGEKLATEAGQSVEFHDFRPYQKGDELRYVDWKVYARTGKIYTRLYQAERNIALYLLLDTSLSMSIGNKAKLARIVAEIITYVAQKDSMSQVFLFNGDLSPFSRGRKSISETWSFIENAVALNDQVTPVNAIKGFALNSKFRAGAGLALIISDLFDKESLRPALIALKARNLDASFLQILAQEDIHPAEDRLELQDVESADKLRINLNEVQAYKQAVHKFLAKTRSAIMQAGFKHLLLISNEEDDNVLERKAFFELIKANIIIKS